MTSQLFFNPKDKSIASECSAPWDYQAVLRYLWRNFSAGGIYE